MTTTKEDLKQMNFTNYVQYFAGKVFRLMTFLIVALMAYYLYLVVQIYNYMQKNKGVTHQTLDYPEFSKIFWVPIVSAFALYCFKRQIVNVSVPYFKIVCKDQHDMKLVNARAERAGAALYKALYYFATSVTGYIVMKDSEILPWYLGGNGDIANIWTGGKGMPY